MRVVSSGLHNRSVSVSRVTALEDVGANENAITTKLHHEDGISRNHNATSFKVDNWESA